MGPRCVAIVIALAACAPPRATAPTTPRDCPCPEDAPLVSSSPPGETAPVPMVVEKRRYYVNFLPFGLPQIQNGHRGKAAAFGVGQAVAVTTSIGVFVYLSRSYGFHGDHVPIEDARRVRHLQQLQIASGVAFVGLYTWSIIDALVNYEPIISIDGTQISIAPAALPDGAGVALSWSR